MLRIKEKQFEILNKIRNCKQYRQVKFWGYFVMMTQKQKYGYRFMYLIACQAVKYYLKNPKRPATN